ncbi:hypothetical protein OsI_32356 [Oryza sativa Indica Group]|uniref:DUF1618 domain-containing protein n=1 Tax=Oryza sativa subsp. indica TaxID=39946 RepID=A2Z3Z1_ORYSI|nr:hypothetical protein OsI_32356 [Oryza sativa Indica Group]
MATVDRYMWNKTEHLTLRPPCHGGDPLDAHQPLPWILLDVRAYIADRRNAATAAADLGNGHRIEITIFTAPPPQVSYICAWCPTGDPARIFANEPLVGCVNADLVFLRLYSEVVYDLVYRAGGRPSLTLIRDPVDVDAASLQRDYLRSLLLSGSGPPSSHTIYGSLQTLPLRVHHPWRWQVEPGEPPSTPAASNDRLDDDGQGVVAFIDLKRGIHICNVLAHGCPGSYLPLPPELTSSRMSFFAGTLPSLMVFPPLMRRPPPDLIRKADCSSGLTRHQAIVRHKQITTGDNTTNSNSKQAQ